VTRNFKREKNGAPALRQIRRSRTRQLQLSMIGHTQRPVIRCWLGGSTRICDAQAAPPRICDAQAAPPTLPSVAALASAASFPFPGHPTNPGSAEENDGMQACKEGSRPGEEGLISRSEIKARSPPQAAPSNSAACGGRQSQFNSDKPSL
jgi:hypothetical protein